MVSHISLFHSGFPFVNIGLIKHFNMSHRTVEEIQCEWLLWKYFMSAKVVYSYCLTNSYTVIVVWQLHEKVPKHSKYSYSTPWSSVLESTGVYRTSQEGFRGSSFTFQLCWLNYKSLFTFKNVWNLFTFL